MSTKAIFDAVRKVLGRGFTQAEVDQLNAAIGETCVTPEPPTEAEQPGIPVVIGPEGMALIKSFEGCAKKRPDGKLDAYPDPGTGGDPWTIGWGATGTGISKGVIWTQAQAEARFELDMQKYAEAVSKAIGTAPTSQRQFDALVSFHYNTGAIATATLTRKHKAGDFAGAAAEFLRWNKAGGRVLPGLTRRRQAEADLYRAGSK